jgi:hypothetical protein
MFTIDTIVSLSFTTDASVVIAADTFVAAILIGTAPASRLVITAFALVLEDAPADLVLAWRTWKMAVAALGCRSHLSSIQNRSLLLGKDEDGRSEVRNRCRIAKDFRLFNSACFVWQIC